MTTFIVEQEKPAEYQGEYHFIITVGKNNYERPKLYIPKVLKNGKKVPTVAPGKRWYIYFRYEGKLVKLYKGLNKFRTVSDRKRVGLALQEAITEALRRGWSPLEKK
ncbi:hypothetical protein SAMN05192588_2721 [Nonlabens sp. Hel1_33_55]|uniref:hypothetical protein n=1 Tax=Nonlabens sp. Hel1_33_55 TaxID=1336802 RepID=UPI000875C76D|nr:hypothetical protein [Nonlabens sp. Hel1_33_55]SCY40808.1 hypothetical protein SAMN05192588_2721 [Nonlabens sp. Hel1_33_55]